MNNEFKVIPTYFNGVQFRSRLEARWAVFFRTLHINYEWEPESFDLGNGICYIPDFYLPKYNGGIYCEVKPHDGDFRKSWFFTEKTGNPILLCEGQPERNSYVLLERFPANGLILQRVKHRRIHILPKMWDPSLSFEDLIPGLDKRNYAIQRAQNERFGIFA